MSVVRITGTPTEGEVLELVRGGNRGSRPVELGGSQVEREEIQEFVNMQGCS